MEIWGPCRPLNALEAVRERERMSLQSQENTEVKGAQHLKIAYGHVCYIYAMADTRQWENLNV